MFKRIYKKNNINKIFNKIDIFYGLILGLLSFLLSDFIAYITVGKYISIILFIVTISIFIFDNKKGFIIILLLLFIFPDIPRDIVELRNIFNTLNVPFYTINSTKISGITLSQYLIIFTTIYILLTKKIKIIKPIKYFILILALLFMTTLIATLLNILVNDREIFIRIMVSELKIFIILFAGVIYGLFLINNFTNPSKLLVKIILFIGLINGFKTISFLIHDVIKGSYSLSFSAQPYMIIPATIALLYVVKKLNLYNIITITIMFFGGLSISRGDMLFFFIDIIIISIFILQQRKILFKIKKIFRVIIFLSFIVFIPILSLFFFNERAFNFLVYKYSFFTKVTTNTEISSSPKVRVYEFKNIYCEESNNIYPLIIGKGIGSYFTYKCVPIEIKLSLSDYNEHDLKLQKFFKPHTFLNYILLKGGILMLFFYIIIPLKIFIYGKELFYIKNDKFTEYLGVFSMLYSIFALNMFWLSRYIFFTFILFIVLLYINYYRKGTI